MKRKIKSALVSVYAKEGLGPIVKGLHNSGVHLISTGGTKKFIEDLGIPVTAVDELTAFPEILGGRVKTLHPKIFGGILARRNNGADADDLAKTEISPIDLVIVDLYPFRETLAAGAPDSEVIEKIDIGGVSLIRAAAKNFQDVVVVSSRSDYSYFSEILQSRGPETTLEERKQLAGRAFQNTSGYDQSIGAWLGGTANPLRYGENPHQKGIFYGNLEEVFRKLGGKELSYNNLADLDTLLGLVKDLDPSAFVIVKHNNPCGVAVHTQPGIAWEQALACDPVSAFGGVIGTNSEIDETLAQAIHPLFFEVLAAPSFTPKALALLGEKKNRILLQTRKNTVPDSVSKTVLNGLLYQERDAALSSRETGKVVTGIHPDEAQWRDLLFAEIVVKHARSNAIVLAKDKCVVGIGAGLTSRVDALRHAIFKAREAGMDLKGASMASDAFFPFSDSVELAQKEGISAIIQPGGSVRDLDSINFCNQHGMAMVFTGIRHFKH